MKKSNNYDKFLKDRYDPINNRTIFYSNSPRLKKIMSMIKPTARKISVLDIGCYDGEIAMQMKDRFGKSCKMYGIDSAKNTLKAAKEKGIMVKYCDINKGISYPKNTFDYVFAGEIIEHIYDTDFFIDEIKRVLTPNGRLIITTPNLLSFGRRIMYFLGKGVFMEASLTYPKDVAGHVRFFTKDLLINYLGSKKFKLEKYTSDTVNFPAFKSDMLANVFPTIGQSLICSFKNVKKD